MIKTEQKIDLHTEMWLQCKITLIYKLLDALTTQIDELQEILTNKKKLKRWVRL